MRNMKKFLALVLATLMIVGAMVATTVSAAEADHTAAVEVLNRIDVYRGYGNDVMGDQDLVTRWHMALFVSRITTGFTNDSAWNGTTNETPFTDVTKDNYLGAISSAYKAGIILGVGDNKFAPNANIKYQEALTMVVRALGYKDLDYPLGYIQKAQALGLTDNLNELDNKLETAITRGQTAEILFNALFATCKDGTTLGADVLKLQLANVTVVGTPKQAINNGQLASAGKVVVRDDKGVEFQIPASALLEEGETAEDLIGYAFKIATNNKWETLVTAYRCASATLYNYGDEKNEIKYVQVGYAPNITFRDNMIKLNGTNYSWNGMMAGYPDFVAYRITDAIENQVSPQIHYYDTAKNIVDPITGEVILYNLDGVYYVNIGMDQFQALRKATAQEIEDAKRDLYISAGNLDTYDTFECYEQIVDCADIWDNKFCELKVFDSNGDGKWDYGIFTPYIFGQYTKQAKDVTVTGKTAEVGDYILYTYNKFTKVYDIKTNLGALKRGKATEINGRGSYVVIDGNKYGYALNDANLCGLNAASDIKINLLQAVIIDGTYAVDYLAEAGYLLKTGALNPYGYTSYVAFAMSDIVGLDANNNLVVNAIIDATGVKKEVKIADYSNYKVGARIAYAISKTPAQQNPDQVSNDQFYVGYVAGNNTSANAITKAKVLAAYAKAVAGEDGVAAMTDYFATTVHAAKVNADGTYSLVPFTPFTDYDPITNKEDKDEVNFVNQDTKNAVTVTINYGINDKAYVTKVADEDKLIATAGKFDTTSSVVYIFAGNDTIKIFKGVAKNGSKIYLGGENTVLLNATADCVFVYDKTLKAEELYSGWAAEAPAVQTPDNDYAFYAVVKETKAFVSNTGADGKATLKLENVQNVLTGEKTTLQYTADYATIVNPIFEAINDKYDITDASKASGEIFLVSAKEKRFEFSAFTGDVLDDFADTVSEIWGNKTKYVNVDLGNLNEQYNLVIDGENVPVQSFALTVFWGDGTVQTVDGTSVKANFTAHHNMPDNDTAFIVIDKDGNATGYVFAPGMANN